MPFQCGQHREKISLAAPPDCAPASAIPATCIFDHFDRIDAEQKSVFPRQGQRVLLVTTAQPKELDKQPQNLSFRCF
jgi:hypothetical protein